MWYQLPLNLFKPFIFGILAADKQPTALIKYLHEKVLSLSVLMFELLAFTDGAITY